jgi:hypothetical protein
MLYKGLNIVRTTTEYSDAAVNKWEPAEQQADCCEEIPDADPCTDAGKTEAWDGYKGGESGDWNIETLMAKWRKTLGDKLVGYQIRSVGGPLNGPCGTKKTTWEGTLSCCEYPPPMFWGDQQTINTVSVEETYTYYVSGGTISAYDQGGSISYSIVGTGARIIAQTNDLVRVKIDICMCDPVLLVATDGCGEQIIKLLYLDDGSWDSAADEAMWSDYGWNQDGIQNVGSGDGARVFVYGFNDDRTTYSVQSYGYGLFAEFDSIVSSITADS